MIRCVVPDSHGSQISRSAMQAFLQDLKQLDPEEIVMLGDHVDCSGTFSSFKKQTKEDLEYSYLRDIESASAFLDAIQERAPKAKIHYLQGNHEYHVERFCVNAFGNRTDADFVGKLLDPATLLDLKGRGIQYYRLHTVYHSLSIPGTIKLGKCYFTHGVSANKHAAATHVERFGANVVFGHTHRAQSHVVRTVTSGEVGAWCPGTLSELQPIYLHTTPSNWTNGYGVQLVNKKTGVFLHINVPIVKGISMLSDFVSRMVTPNERRKTN